MICLSTMVEDNRFERQAAAIYIGMMIETMLGARGVLGLERHTGASKVLSFISATSNSKKSG